MGENICTISVLQEMQIYVFVYFFKPFLELTIVVIVYLQMSLGLINIISLYMLKYDPNITLATMHVTYDVLDKGYGVTKLY